MELESNVAAEIMHSWSRNMSRGMPSMTALLSLLALAGYQNRDKLAELLKGKRLRALAIACQRSGMVRAAVACNSAFNLEKAISIGLKSGL